MRLLRRAQRKEEQLHHSMSCPLPIFLDLESETSGVSVLPIHENSKSHQSLFHSFCLFQFSGAEFPDGPSCGPYHHGKDETEGRRHLRLESK